MIKANLGKYANPKLAQGAKAAVLASITEYLNGDEFIRIVSAPLNYTSPDFVVSTEQELASVGISYTPTNARQGCDRQPIIHECSSCYIKYVTAHKELGVSFGSVYARCIINPHNLMLK